MKRASLSLLALVAALAACGVETTKVIDKDEIAERTQAYFDDIARKSGGERFPKIICKEDLDGKEGESTRCSATGDDGTLGITVTVKSADEDRARLNFKADDKLTK